MKSLVPWPFRQTGRLKICAYCGLRASAFGFPWPAAAEMPATASQKLILNVPLSHNYDSGITTVSELISRAFYVAASGRYHHDGSMINALYWQSYGGDREELVDDINDLTAMRSGRLLNIVMQLGNSPLYLMLPLRETV
ncbi:MAG: hypothetical protein GY821_14075 [Gammaproteobacteria bacterium]|nr:hypothetical protein [Gammaproteobacteria bacterium]